MRAQMSIQVLAPKQPLQPCPSNITAPESAEISQEIGTSDTSASVGQQQAAESRGTGAAVAFRQPFPFTIISLKGWIRSLNERGVVLAPDLAFAGRQVGR